MSPPTVPANMGYKPLEAYGIIGNLETCPLVGRDGSIDWCCFPQLESSSVFAALLDDEIGGRFAIQPTSEFTATQAYIERTNVLQTHFQTDTGTATLTDFMPVLTGMQLPHTPHAIYRKLTCTEGPIQMGVEFDPRFDFGRAPTTVEPSTGGVVARGGGEQLYLWSPTTFQTFENDHEKGGTVLSLTDEETVWFVLQYNDREPCEAAACETLLDRTIDYWQDWTHDCSDTADCPFAGPWHDQVIRSELVLRLLMNPITHAIAAAPTTSLPEVLGGERNWDYRYAWIRDTAVTIQALYDLGHTREARNGYDWCLSMCHKNDPGQLDHPLYGLHYKTDMTETTLDHFTGYRGSSPVRVGNAAGKQVQFDSYGELLTAIYTATNHGETLSADVWEVLRDIIEYVCEIWTDKDSGIWEARVEPQHNVHSKVLCWAAIDRGIRLAEESELDAPLTYWRDERQAIHETVLEEGYNEDLGSFTQTFDGKTLDAVALDIARNGFLPIDDERIQGTIDAVMERLTTSEGLVRRYEGDDGLAGEDNPFVMCTFWLVECLALSGRTEQAREVFESTLEYASPLGLFAEEIDPETGEGRGNFPQAFSHVGLISSVRYLRLAETGDLPAPIGSDPSSP